MHDANFFMMFDKDLMSIQMISALKKLFATNSSNSPCRLQQGSLISSGSWKRPVQLQKIDIPVTRGPDTAAILSIVFDASH